jgi:hypothetical protein
VKFPLLLLFFFLTNIALLKLGTKVPTIGKSKRGRLTFPLQMREEGGGGGNKWECSPKKLLLHYKWERKRRGGGGLRRISGNAVRKNSCRGSKCHMVNAEVSTSMNFPSLSKGRGRKK